LGPAVGGTRWWTYARDEEAVTDALRLSRGMSYKNAMAGLPLGGGKSVILGRTGAQDRAGILRAHGRFIQRLHGIYITGEDVGTTPADMELISETTSFVAGRAGTSGDPSPHTGRGVFRALQAAAQFRWGSTSLEGRTVALQGCGNVGTHLARHVATAGARLLVSDIDDAKAERLAEELGAHVVPTTDIHAAEADIFSPCALGAVINDVTLPELRVQMVVGGANNQLLESRHGDLLHQRGILYVPDYIANAGGVTWGGSLEVLKLSREEALARVEAIFDTTLEVLERAKQEGIPPHQAADRVAQDRIAQAALNQRESR
jgi:leucine dehydrogenase